MPASFTDNLFNVYLKKVNEEIIGERKIIIQMSEFDSYKPLFKNDDFKKVYCIYHDSKNFKILIEVDKKAEEIILYNPNGTAFGSKINEYKDEVVKLVCGGNPNLKYQVRFPIPESGPDCLETIAWMIENVLLEKTETMYRKAINQKSWKQKITEKIKSGFGLK